MFNRISVRSERHSRARSFVLFGLAGFALVMTAAAKDVTLNAPVDVETTVTAVREAPAGSPLPGIHLDANVRGRVMDIYISPANFAVKYGVRLSKGDYIHIVGTEIRSGDADVVLARSITTGSVDKKSGTFHEDLTTYLRNDEGPLW